MVKIIAYLRQLAVNAGSIYRWEM